MKTLKILFICGSLEPGRDGVGDYVRRLSLEVLRQGHQVSLAAINDRHITSTIKSAIEIDNCTIPIFRVPSVIKNVEKITLIQEWVTIQDPDWLSLQFVPFSFEKRGLFFGLAKSLKTLGKHRKFHIMFHELWVGMDEESGNKELLWGIAQRYLIKNLLNTLKPKIVHTHVEIYKKHLEKLNSTVELLPLFSNIPVCNPNAIADKLTHSNEDVSDIDLIIFGGVHSGAPIAQLALEAAAYSKRHSTQIRLVVIGKGGTEQTNAIKVWEDAGLKAINLGEQSEQKVSELLTDAQYGIFTTPIGLVGKSGSVAAMREHGLHLLCVSRRWNPRGIDVMNNLFNIQEYKEGCLDSFFSTAPDLTWLPTLTKITEQFILNLNSTE